ncbi:MAG: GWxTD domain-containing protein [bacterium]
MTAITGLLFLVGALQFTVDWAGFRARGDSTRVEVFYAVPYEQLHYSTAPDSGVEARFAVSVAMTGTDGGFSQSGVIQKRARLRSFAAAQRAQTTFVDGFSIIAPPGRYALDVSVTESVPGGINSGTRSDTVELRSLADGLTLSSLQIGTSATVDSATGSVLVVPNPALQEGIPGQELVYVYLEAYGFETDSGSSDIRLGVLKRRPGQADTTLRESAVTKERQSRSLATAVAVNVEGLEPGGYVLFAELADPASGRTARSEHPLRIGPPAPDVPTTTWLQTLTPTEQKHVRELKYLATPRELAYYNSLGDSGQAAYLAWFWSKRNLAEFARRMETVEARYARPKTPGVSTDRGRIYVKYGEPDAVEQRVIESDLRPREYWQYYGTGYSFIFIDLRGDGNARLAWTNAPDEPATGFEEYLSPEEQREFK